MDGKLLAKVFKNPQIEEEIYRFCMEFPEYQQSKKEVKLCFSRLEQLLDYEQLDALEEAIAVQQSWEMRACYLFGLNLRKELRAALFTGAC